MRIGKKPLFVLFGMLIFILMFAFAACDLGGSGGGNDTVDNDDQTTDGHVPVYQGMTISDGSTSASTASTIAPLAAGGQAGNSGNHYGWYKDKEVDQDEPFGDDSEAIEDVIDSSLKVTGSVAPIYYATPNEDIFITVHINNPDNYVILSFQLNGTTYSSYMFEAGSDMENLVLKVNVGNVSGVVEYTIDAIKYVDGTEIKDVLLYGDQTVRAGIRVPNQVNALVAETVRFNDISLEVDISDDDGLIAYSGGTVKAVLYDGARLVGEKTLNLGQNTVIFDKLDVATLYQYAIVGYFDNLQTGCDWNVLYKNASYTETPVIFDNVSVTPKGISFSFTWHKDATVSGISTLSLLKEGEVRKLDVKTDSLDDLSTNSDYTLVATYTYSGKEVEIKYDFHTLPQGYTITYHLNGGENAAENPAWYEETSGAIRLAKAKREDYTFMGWYEEDTFQTPVTEIPQGARRDIELYAKWAYGTDGLEYTLFEGIYDGPFVIESYYFVSGYTGTDEKVTIPEEWDGHPVRMIGRQAFYGKTFVVRVSIPEGVTSIGESAFASTGLTSISLPGSLTEIGSNAFSSCSRLESLTIPENIYRIDTGAFQNCTSLKEVYWNATSCSEAGGLTVQIFTGCTAKATVVIGDNVSRIPDYAFQGFTGLTSVTIGASVGYIGSYAFAGCWDLKEIYWNATDCYEVGWSQRPTFSGDSGVTTVVFGENVRRLPDYAFLGLSGLESVVIPLTVTTIGSYAFQGCNNLTIYAEAAVKPGGWSAYWNDGNRPVVWNYGGEHGVTEDGLVWALRKDNAVAILGYTGSSTAIEIPEQINGHDVAVLVDSVFYSEYYPQVNFESITIPDTVTSIGNRAFYYCFYLTTVNIGQSSKLTSIGESAFSGCSNLASIVIPDKVIAIGNSAFANCWALKSVEFGSSLALIGDSAFVYCSALKSVVIPDSVTSLGTDAFQSCSALQSVVVGKNVTTLSARAFSNCDNLIEFTMGDRVTTIEQYAISGGQLTKIVIPASVTRIESEVFYACYKLIEVWNYSSVSNSYLTKYAKRIYKTDEPSKQTKTEDGYLFFEDGDEAYLLGYVGEDRAITLPQTSPSGKGYAIYQFAFSGAALESIVIPDAVTAIGARAFSNCYSLASVTIGKGVRSIGENAFYNCRNLPSIVIPGNVTTIGESAFMYCTGLRNVTIEDGVREIGEFSFMYCEWIETIKIPGSVSTVERSAFRNCTNLRSVILEEGVSAIGDWVFRDCNVLASIVLPQSLSSIGEYAFDGSPLTSIYYMGTAETWFTIIIASHNENFYFVPRYYYSDSENRDGAHWHFVEGVPTVW